MRNRAWRRYKQDCKVVKRLKRMTRWGYFASSDNGITYQHCSLSNLLGTDTHHMYKTYTTCKSDSRYKSKYSPNNTNSHYRENLRKGKRETDKMSLINLMKNIC